MTSLRKLFKHATNYSIGKVFLLIANFISFPIFTRLLSTDEYGKLNLINAIILLSVTFSKFGLSKSASRFYHEFSSQKRNTSVSQFYSTLYFSTLIIGVFVSLILTNVKQWIIPDSTANIGISNLFIFVTILIPLTCAASVFQQFLRAEQKATYFNLIRIFSRYASIGFAIFFVIYYIKGLKGLLFGRTVVAFIVFLIITYVLLKKRKISFKYFSFSFFKESVKYGLPLIFFELTSNILAYGDRLLIAHFLGPGELGIYSAGYNISMYCSNMVYTPLNIAILPIYMEVWINEGEEKTKKLLSSAFNYYLLIAIPIIFGFSALGKDIITLLASEKYYEAYKIIPFVISSLTIYGGYVIFAAGIYIYKKTYKLTMMFVIGCALNIILNMMLIPKFGIIGAAASTSIAYLTLLTLVIIYSFRLLSFKIYFSSILRFTIFSFLMFVIINNIHINNLILNLLIKICTGFLLYSTFIFLFDMQIRKKIFGKIFQ